MDYTTTEAASLLNLQPVTIRQYIFSGLIKSEKRGRDYFITQEELDRFTRERRGRGRPAKQQAD